MERFAIIPAAHGSSAFARLSRTRQGQIFEKHILNYGTLHYPGVRGGKVEIDEAFADTLIENFEAGVCDIVQVPLAGPNNEHSEDPTRNIGEVVEIVKRDNKIFVRIDVRDEVSAARMGKTLLGASAMLAMNYTDTRTLQKVGPTLLHVAITNRPYIPGLEDFTGELLAASADGVNDAVVLTAQTREDPMTLDEMLAELKADHGIDVTALQEAAQKGETAVALSAAVQDALGTSGIVSLSAGEEPTTEVLVKAITDAGESIVTLSNEVQSLKEADTKKDAEAHVDSLVRSGHILPKHRDAQVTLMLSNKDLFDELLPENPLVTLSNEQGTAEEPATDQTTAQSEVARLTASPGAAPYVKQS